ncbi:hypothetical protein AgCh_028816 [Apium graveolens]
MGSGAPNPEVQEHQYKDVLLDVGDQIVNPIKYPNEGPDEIHIGNIAVEDVIPEGIAAEEDLVEGPDENKERTAEELMTVVRATTRARMAARVALEDEELPRAQRIIRSEGVGPSTAPIIPVSDPLPEVPVDIHEVPPIHVPSPVQSPAPTEEMPPLSPAPLSPDIVLGYPFRSPGSDLLDRITASRIEGGVLPAGLAYSMERIEATTRITARGHLEGQIDPALLATILDLITALMEQGGCNQDTRNPKRNEVENEDFKIKDDPDYGE